MKQRHNRSCGPTAVINLTRMLGYKKFSYKQVRDRIETLPTGTPLSKVGPELRRLIGRKYVVHKVKKGKLKLLVDHLNAGNHAILAYSGGREYSAHYVAVGKREGRYYPVANDVPVFKQKTVTMRTLEYLKKRNRGRVTYYNQRDYPHYWLVKPRKAR